MSLSYAGSDLPWFKATFVRIVERMTGAGILHRRYRQWQETDKERLAANESFWSHVIQSLGISVCVKNTVLGPVPATGSLLIVANHPYGVVDGAAIASLVERSRKDLKIIIWDVITPPDEIQQYFLPLDLDSPRQQMLRQNVGVRRDAIRHLRSGGSVLLFPAGCAEMSTTALSAPEEAPWTRMAAKLLRASGADVLPVFVPGHNSRLFHCVTHLGDTFRRALFIYETCRLRGTTIPLVVGDLIPAETIREFGVGMQAERNLMDSLRTLTLSLEVTSLQASERDNALPIEQDSGRDSRCDSANVACGAEVSVVAHNACSAKGL